MYVLMVSKNLGIQYHVQARASRLSILEPAYRKLDEENYRWYVKNEDRIVQVCQVWLDTERTEPEPLSEEVDVNLP